MSRPSCSFCSLAFRADLLPGREFHPELYSTYVEIEQYIGHTLLPTRQPLPEGTGASPDAGGGPENPAGPNGV